jgi:hypothetical protein
MEPFMAREGDHCARRAPDEQVDGVRFAEVKGGHAQDAVRARFVVSGVCAPE